jgi:hypothetical protein
MYPPMLARESAATMTPLSKMKASVVVPFLWLSISLVAFWNPSNCHRNTHERTDQRLERAGRIRRIAVKKKGGDRGIGVAHVVAGGDLGKLEGGQVVGGEDPAELVAGGGGEVVVEGGGVQPHLVDGVEVEQRRRRRTESESFSSSTKALFLSCGRVKKKRRGLAAWARTRFINGLGPCWTSARTVLCKRKLGELLFGSSYLPL